MPLLDTAGIRTAERFHPWITDWRSEASWTAADKLRKTEAVSLFYNWTGGEPEMPNTRKKFVYFSVDYDTTFPTHWLNRVDCFGYRGGTLGQHFFRCDARQFAS